MTETEKKALALLNEARAKLGFPPFDRCDRSFYAVEALCRAIEQHEAFRQEVSDAVTKFWPTKLPPAEFQRFIIPKPSDPLVEALQAVTWQHTMEDACASFRAALAARGLEVRKIGEGSHD